MRVLPLWLRDKRLFDVIFASLSNNIAEDGFESSFPDLFKS